MRFWKIFKSYDEFLDAARVALDQIETSLSSPPPPHGREDMRPDQVRTWEVELKSPPADASDEHRAEAARLLEKISAISARLRR